MFKKSTFIWLIILFDVLSLSLIFSVSGLYNTNVDTSDYVEQIKFYDGTPVDDLGSVERRQFKPLYGVVGSTLTPFLDPKSAILLINVLFFVGLSILFFLLLERLGFSSELSFAGTLWLIFGYPLLKYGLSLGTDISGWFFAVLSSYIGILGIQKDKLYLLAISSVIGFVGFLSKETGVLGLGLVGVLVIFEFSKKNYLDFLKKLLSISLPFFVLESLYFLYLKAKNYPTFLDWYKVNQDGITSYQTLSYLLGIEFASFNIVLLLGGIGIYYAVKSKDMLSLSWLRKFLSLFVVSLPMLAWPIYITRIMYIQFLFFIPMALYGVENIFKNLKNGFMKNILIVFVVVAPIIFNILLFLFGHNKSLFDVLMKIV